MRTDRPQWLRPRDLGTRTPGGRAIEAPTQSDVNRSRTLRPEVHAAGAFGAEVLDRLFGCIPMNELSTSGFAGYTDHAPGPQRAVRAHQRDRGPTSDGWRAGDLGRHEEEWRANEAWVSVGRDHDEEGMPGVRRQIRRRPPIAATPVVLSVSCPSPWAFSVRDWIAPGPNRIRDSHHGLSGQPGAERINIVFARANQLFAYTACLQDIYAARYNLLEGSVGAHHCISHARDCRFQLGL